MSIKHVFKIVFHLIFDDFIRQIIFHEAFVETAPQIR
jgi:hypothetical protein